METTGNVKFYFGKSSLSSLFQYITITQSTKPLPLSLNVGRLLDALKDRVE